MFEDHHIYHQTLTTIAFCSTKRAAHQLIYKITHACSTQRSIPKKKYYHLIAESAAVDKQSHLLHSTAFKIPVKNVITSNIENRIPFAKFEPILRGHGSNGVLISPSLIMQMENLKEPQTLLKPIASSSSSTQINSVIGHFTSLRQLRQMNEVSDDGDDCDAADREVCSLMSPDEPPMPPPRRLTTNASTSPSIASGSWSKMRVVRLNQKFHKFQGAKDQPETSLFSETAAPPRHNFVSRIRGAINLDALNEPRALSLGGIIILRWICMQNLVLQIDS